MPPTAEQKARREHAREMQGKIDNWLTFEQGTPEEILARHGILPEKGKGLTHYSYLDFARNYGLNNPALYDWENGLVWDPLATQGYGEGERDPRDPYDPNWEATGNTGSWGAIPAADYEAMRRAQELRDRFGDKFNPWYSQLEDWVARYPSGSVALERGMGNYANGNTPTPATTGSVLVGDTQPAQPTFTGPNLITAPTPAQVNVKNSMGGPSKPTNTTSPVNTQTQPANNPMIPGAVNVKRKKANELGGRVF